MLKKTASETAWSRYGLAPSLLVIPAATVALATVVGLAVDNDKWIYWTLAAGCLTTVAWATLFWSPPVMGSTGWTGRISLLAGLVLFAVGQVLLGLVEAGRGSATEESLTALNNGGGMFGSFGALLGLIGFAMTLALATAVKLGWTSGWQLAVLFGGVGVALVILIAAIVSQF